MPRTLSLPTRKYPSAGLARRLAASLYDSILLVALIMVATLGYFGGLAAWMGGSRLKAMAEQGELIGDPILSILIVLVSFAYFAGYWIHNGQTLGMQAWKIRIQNTDGTRISLPQAALHFAAALFSYLCLGVGLLWILVDTRRRSWSDLASKSQTIHILE